MKNRTKQKQDDKSVHARDSITPSIGKIKSTNEQPGRPHLEPPWFVVSGENPTTGPLSLSREENRSEGDKWLKVEEEVALLRALSAGLGGGFTEAEAEEVFDWAISTRIRANVLELALMGVVAIRFRGSELEFTVSEPDSVAEPSAQCRLRRTNLPTDAVIIQDGQKWVVPEHSGDRIFDSIDEARDYCADNNLRIVQEQYS